VHRIVRNIRGKRVAYEISVSVSPLTSFSAPSTPPVANTDTDNRPPIAAKLASSFVSTIKRDPATQKMWVLLDSFANRSHEWQQRQQAGAERDGLEAIPAASPDRKEQRMKVFSMDAENRIAILDAEETRDAMPEGVDHFQTEQQLASLTASWPTSRLVAVWNLLPGVQPVKRFTDRKTAVQRIWKVLQGPSLLEPNLRPIPGERRLSRAADAGAKARRLAQTPKPLA